MPPLFYTVVSERELTGPDVISLQNPSNNQETRQGKRVKLAFTEHAKYPYVEKDTYPGRADNNDTWPQRGNAPFSLEDLGLEIIVYTATTGCRGATRPSIKLMLMWLGMHELYFFTSPFGICVVTVWQWKCHSADCLYCNKPWS